MSRYKVKRVLNIDRTEKVCDECGKVCKGEKALKSHKTQMHSGPKDTSHRGKPKGTDAWNKGLTKETDERVKKNAESCSVTYQKQIKEGTRPKRSMGEAARKELSVRQSLNNSGGRCKWYTVAGQRVQGTWERDIATKFEELGIQWYKLHVTRDVWSYEIDGKIRSYTPDFYLPDYDLFLEVKGYWWGNDREKVDVVLQTHTDKNIFIIEKEQYNRILQGELVWSHQRRTENP